MDREVVVELRFLVLDDLGPFLLDGCIVEGLAVWRCGDAVEEMHWGEPKEEHFWVAVQYFSILVLVEVTVTVLVCHHQWASATIA